MEGDLPVNDHIKTIQWWIDYYNALFTGLPKKSVRKLQLIQNAAAKLTKTKKREHIIQVFTLAPS